MINQPAFLDRFTVISSDKNTAETYIDHVLAASSQDAFTLTALARPNVDLAACLPGHLDDIDDGGFRDPGADIWIEQHGDALIDALLKNHGIEIHADPDYPADDPGYYWQRGDQRGDTWDTPQETRLQALIAADLTLKPREADGVIVPPDMPDAQPRPAEPAALAKPAALAFYEALIDGMETLGAAAEKHGPMAIVNLVYLLGGMMREDAGAPGSPSGICVELWDHHDDLGLLDLLNEIKAESPELAPAIQLGLNKIHVMPLED